MNNNNSNMNYNNLNNNTKPYQNGQRYVNNNNNYNNNRYQNNNRVFNKNVDQQQPPQNGFVGGNSLENTSPTAPGAVPPQPNTFVPTQIAPPAVPQQIFDGSAPNMPPPVQQQNGLAPQNAYYNNRRFNNNNNFYNNRMNNNGNTNGYYKNNNSTNGFDWGRPLAADDALEKYVPFFIAIVYLIL